MMGYYILLAYGNRFDGHISNYCNTQFGSEMALELCDRVQSLLLNFRLHIHNDFVSPESVYVPTAVVNFTICTDLSGDDILLHKQ